MTEFAEPDWGAKLDPEKWIQATPKDATCKGMFMSSLVDIARHQGADLSDERFHRFQDYPMTRWFGLAIECCRVAFPGDNHRKALRRIGNAVYPMFFDTMVGKAIFAVAATDAHRIMRLASRAYDVSIKPGGVTLAEVTDNRVVVQLRDVYSFADSYQVGIWEGMMQTLRLKHVLKVRSQSLENVDFEITW